MSGNRFLDKGRFASSLDLANFTDYRAYLLEFYRLRKTQWPGYSYRILAARLDMDVSHVHRILNGRIHLPVACVPRVADALGLDAKASRLLLGMVLEGRRKIPTARRISPLPAVVARNAVVQ